MKRPEKEPILISFTGYSGSGKTTFIVKLIRELKARGLRFAVIKHDAHEFDIDKKGKDTSDYFEAGADAVGIFSRTKAAVYGNTQTMLPASFEGLAASGGKYDKTGPALLELIRVYFPGNLDLIIIEGCRDSTVPKIGFSRKATGKGLSLDPAGLSAVITDEENIEHKYIFGIEDVRGVADFILSKKFQDREEDMKKANEDFPIRISAAEAQDILAAVPLELRTEYIPVYETQGRVSSEEHLAAEDFPPFRRSPLDGYAFIAADTAGADEKHPVTLKITEEIPAGFSPEIKITSGYAAKVLTGAPVPDGADAVEKYESTEFTADTVKIFREFKPDTNIVPRGEDYLAGTTLVKKGIRLGAFDVSVLAMLGEAKVAVYRKPVITFISTGTELVDVETKELPPGHIRNSSVFTLAGIAEQEGAEAIYGGIVKDETEQIAQAVKKFSEGSDIIITTGGVSAGDYDLVVDALEKIGAKVLFWKVRMKPGMACAAAVYNGTVILALSGNPSAAAVAMDVLGRPVIRRACGLSDFKMKPVSLKLAAPMNKKSPMGRYIRGRLIIEDGLALFMPGALKGNGTTTGNQSCNVLAFVPPGTVSMEAGEFIEAYIL